MSNGHDATKTRRRWIGILVLLAALLLASAAPGDTWRGKGGFRGAPPGFRGMPHGLSGRHHAFRGVRPDFRTGHHSFRRGRVFIEPRIVVPFGLFWAPYWAVQAYPSMYPPVVVQSRPEVYVQPQPPQPFWYYCEHPPGYYPYVPQCPAGWRAVSAVPPRPE